MTPITNRNAHLLELVTNIAVVFAGIMLVGFYSASYFGFAKPASFSSLSGQTIGEIKNVNFQDSSETLVIVVMTRSYASPVQFEFSGEIYELRIGSVVFLWK